MKTLILLMFLTISAQAHDIHMFETPEPASALMIGGGIVVIGLLARKRGQK